jgi:uncharacterized protein YbaP (TraB family)
MKRFSAAVLMCLVTLAGCTQNGPKPVNEKNSLLWKISGHGLDKPSYLFGTIHLLCEEDAMLSDSLKKAIRRCDNVYLEVDINDLFEMIGAMSQMTMRDDTTLADLLSKADYEKVKNYFESKGSMLPFSMLEKFKPIFAASTLEGSSLPCDAPVMMEQLISKEAQQNEKQIKGLETMLYQASVLDSIPYKFQAMQLVSYIDSANKGVDADKEFKEMLEAYKDQDLGKLEELMKESDLGMSSYTDILLYNRNRNWVKKLKNLLPHKSLVIAVGAGHLPGEMGVISLLRKEGYTVTPVQNRVTKTKLL